MIRGSSQERHNSYMSRDMTLPKEATLLSILLNHINDKKHTIAKEEREDITYSCLSKEEREDKTIANFLKIRFVGSFAFIKAYTLHLRRSKD